jgi:hypothetical protein
MEQIVKYVFLAILLVIGLVILLRVVGMIGAA